MYDIYSEREFVYLHGLQTLRTKKAKIKKAEEKMLLALARESKRIQRAKRDLGFEDLLPPVQRGWKRMFVLRHDVAESPYAELYEGILKRINVIRISHRKDFKVKKRRRGKYGYIEVKQDLNELYESEYKKLDEKEQLLFVRTEYVEYKCNKVRYVFTEPWRFVLKTEVNMITRVRVKDPELEGMEDRLQNYMKKNMLWEKINRLHGHRSWRYHCLINEKPKYKNPLKSKQKHMIEFEYKQEITELNKFTEYK